MFDSIRRHQKILQFLLLILIFPAFAFFGLSGYDRFFSGDDDVAIVAESPISAQEFEGARQSQIDNMRRILGDQLDTSMFDTPAARRQILEGLVDQRLLAITAQQNRLTVSDDAVRSAIQRIPGIAGENGSFDFERYKTLLTAQGLTEAQFEASVRADLAVQLLPEAVSRTAFASKTVATHLARLNGQKRTVKSKSFKAEDFIAKVELPADAARKYYDETPQAFQSPEAAKINYLVLSEATLAEQVNVSDQDVSEYYKANQRLFGQPEQRRARHILIESGESSSADEKAAAKDKAQGLLDRIRAGELIETLAKTESDDPGSAAEGGDLGFFDRDTMSSAFADSAFSLDLGEVSDLVETEFGFHIIQVSEIRAESIKPLGEVSTEIEATLGRQKAREAYLEAADSFGNTVYEQPDSLEPTAEKVALTIESLDEFRRFGTPGLAPNSPLNNRKVITAVFSAQNIKSGMNTEAIDVGNNTMVAVRVLEHRPAILLPFEAVEAQAESIVRAARAVELATAAGEQELASLQASSATAPDGFDADQTVSRESRELSAAAKTAVFQVPSSSTPMFVGVGDERAGYQIFEVLKVEEITNEQLKTAVQASADEQSASNGQQSFAAYITALKTRTEIERFENRILGSNANADGYDDQGDMN